jgi:energy-coupling factor transporter ATP-binding protein EcfA2
MLTRVYIDNFRSFRNFEYVPARKQLLFGANGSGKTSLLEVLRRLKSFVAGGSNDFTQSTRTRWLGSSAQVFELEARLNGKKFEYRLELGYAEVTRQQAVTLERLTVSGSTVFELSEGKIRFFPSTGESVAVGVSRILCKRVLSPSLKGFDFQAARACSIRSGHLIVNWRRASRQP